MIAEVHTKFELLDYSGLARASLTEIKKPKKLNEKREVVVLKAYVTVKNLGIDFAFGAKSAEPTRQQRINKVKQRGIKLETIRSAGISTARFYKTANEPAGMYGVGVYGIKAGSLYRLREQQEKHRT